VQTGIELQGPRATLPGVGVSELSDENRRLARTLVDHIFSTYPADDVAYAWRCLEANGGLDRLHLSYYAHGEDGTIAEGQVFRLEGPAAVLYFRGYPHVHAFVNVAMNAETPLSSGEPLGENPTWLDRLGVKALFEAAMRAETGANLAHYPEQSVAGRLRPGLIRSGDIYSLESWQESVVVVGIRGANLSPTAIEKLPTGTVPDPGMIYSIAASSYVARDTTEPLGRIESRRGGPMLREATVSYLKRHGFPAS
jgi:hypothetical protein